MASRQAWAGAQGVLLPSCPATAEGRLDRAACLPCNAAFQTHTLMPGRKREPKNGIESQLVPCMSLSRWIYSSALLLNRPEECDIFLSRNALPLFHSLFFLPLLFQAALSFFLFALLFEERIVIVRACVCDARRVWRPTDGQGGSHSVRSGSEPALRLVGLTREAPPTDFWADLDLTQRFCFVLEHARPWYHIVSALLWKQGCHLSVYLTLGLACVVSASLWVRD